MNESSKRKDLILRNLSPGRQAVTDGAQTERRGSDVRELRYYVACSVDGFIAHEDGSADGFYEQHDGALTKGEHVDDFLESYKWFDIVLMGRKT